MSEAQIIAVFRFHPAQKTVDEMDKLYGEMSDIVSAMPGYVAQYPSGEGRGVIPTGS